MPFIPAHGTCDCCGEEIDKAYSASVLVRGPVVYSDGGFVEDAICFEWWPKGAYCPTCLNLLVSAITRNLEIINNQVKQMLEAD